MHLKHPGGVISDMVGVKSAVDDSELKPVDPIWQVACGSGGGIDGVGLCRVSEDPCREGVDGFLNKECGPGVSVAQSRSRHWTPATCLGHGPEGAVGPDSDQFGADLPAAPAAPMLPGKWNLLQRQLFGPPASVADAHRSGLTSLTSFVALPRLFGRCCSHPPAALEIPVRA